MPNVIGDHRKNMTALLSGFFSLALLATACSGGASGASSAEQTLTIAYPSRPNSLDPAQTNAAFEWYTNLAYDPLISWGPNGTPQPGIATSWHYVGEGNQTFDLTLRSGVRFSDGSPLTADGVKASLEYQKQAGGQAQPFWADKTITVTGPLTLRITVSKPDPLIVRELSQDYIAGNIISATALKNPKQLGTTTDGAGPYELAADETVPGDHYTYTPNPHYWNKSAVHYQKVVIKVIPNPNSILNALKTGQADLAVGDYTTAATARSAGLQVKSVPVIFIGLNLMDRGGAVLPALGDVRVRQALNYAVDRATITKALFGEYGTPTDQTVVPGLDGSLGRPFYGYDPAKAKQLLAEAGYANGLTIPVVTTTSASQSEAVQAIAGDLERVGVKLQITTESDPSVYVSQMLSRRYPVAGISFGGLPVYLEGPSLYLSGAVTFNPFKVPDVQLQALYDKAAAASASERPELDQQIEQWLVSRAWFVPVTLSPSFFYARSTVSGIVPTPGQPTPDPVWFRPSGQH